ncbi:MAG: FtsQ-type POTRA domain-containing protein [Oscillospiraceae bacterium]|nr:FtsQ-type POTRA domain-containing protein [Oscillospiraceae bacterium]
MKDTRIKDNRKERQLLREKANKKNAIFLVKNRKKNYFLYYIVLLFFVIMTLVILCVTVFFNIREINIQGSDIYSTEEILENISLKKGDNLFRINVEDLREQILKKFKFIDYVDIQVKIPDSLDIKVEDASIFLSIKQNDNYIYISKKGRIIGTDDFEGNEENIEIYGLEDVLLSTGDFITKSDNEKIKCLDSIVNVIETETVENINFIDISDVNDIKLIYDNRVEILAGDLLEFDYKMRLVKFILDNKLGKTEFGTINIKNVKKAVFTPRE